MVGTVIKELLIYQEPATTNCMSHTTHTITIPKTMQKSMGIDLFKDKLDIGLYTGLGGGKLVYFIKLTVRKKNEA